MMACKHNSPEAHSFFTKSLKEQDPEINSSVEKELERQQNQIELIASENIVSKAVLEAQGSILTNKYAEGYPDRRYYGGCEYVDEAEQLARERLKQLFDVKYANVQPHSGTQANQAIFLALLQPGDTILGMSLDAGGHLTHGSRVNMSGKWFEAIGYNVDKDSGLIDMNNVRELALKHKPRLIIAGASAYSRLIDFEAFRKIADEINAYFLVDMAHFAGLVAAKEIPSPFPHAHVVTSTTHKTLRGPRGGIILTNDLDLHKKFNSAIFPGLQGGPLMHVIAAKAVAFGEDLKPEFKTYIQQVMRNADILARTLQEHNINIVSGGTDNHLVLVDLRSQSLTGDVVEKNLEACGITCNKNSVPYDPQPPMVTSGIRLGTPAITTRGFKEDDIKEVANLIIKVVEALKTTGTIESIEQEVKERVKVLCGKFPIY